MPPTRSGPRIRPWTIAAALAVLGVIAGGFVMFDDREGAPSEDSAAEDFLNRALAGSAENAAADDAQVRAAQKKIGHIVFIIQGEPHLRSHVRQVPRCGGSHFRIDL